MEKVQEQIIQLNKIAIHSSPQVQLSLERSGD